MTQPDDSELESALGDYLSGKLDGQLGRCQARFLEEIAAAAPVRRRTNRWSLFWWATATGLVAALLLLGITLIWRFSSHQNSSSQKPQMAVAPASQPEDEPIVAYHQTITYRTVDQGTVVLDGEVPARQICRQMIDHVEWIDPAENSPVEVDIPSQEIVYVAMTTY